MLRLTLAARLALAALLIVAAPLATAQSVPVAINVSGNVATAQVGLASDPLAELTLTFDEAHGLSTGSLGISAQLVDITDPALLSRLPAGSLNQFAAAYPLMITIEPPVAGGLRFERTVHVEIHTHALSYTAGSPLRLFKAPIGGSFRDITDDIAPGSIRARGTTDGFSQFLVLADLRPTGEVVDAKFARLQSLLDGLSLTERGPLQLDADNAQSAFAQADYAGALSALEQLRTRVADRAGSAIPAEWRATRDADNQAGALLAQAATLSYSIGYLRDYGH